jgi:hypothetical protein
MSPPTHPNSLPLLKQAQADQHGLLDRISQLRMLAVLADWALDHHLLPSRALLRCPAPHPLPSPRVRLVQQARRLNRFLLDASLSQWLSHALPGCGQYLVRKGQL